MYLVTLSHDEGNGSSIRVLYSTKLFIDLLGISCALKPHKPHTHNYRSVKLRLIKMKYECIQHLKLLDVISSEMLSITFCTLYK